MFVQLQSAVSDRLTNISWQGSPNVYIEPPTDPSYPYVTIDDISKDSTYTDDSEIAEATVRLAIWYEYGLGKVNTEELKQNIEILEDAFDQPLTVADYQFIEEGNRTSSGIIDEINNEDSTHRKKAIITYEYTLIK